MEKNLDFENTVLNLFDEFVNKNRFLVDRNNKSNKIQFVNEKCIIRFINDYGNVECHFVNPAEKADRENKQKKGLPVGYPVYPVYAVWIFFYPNDKINLTYDPWGSIEIQVLFFKKILIEKLSNVVEGDFSWVNAFNNQK